jgi:hypothetical protein
VDECIILFPELPSHTGINRIVITPRFANGGWTHCSDDINFYMEQEEPTTPLILPEKIRKDEQRRDVEVKLQALYNNEKKTYIPEPVRKRGYIPKKVVDAVYSRDGGVCVYCGSVEKLQLDHIIPHSKGGADTLENLQLLCQKCNLEKSNAIG